MSKVLNKQKNVKNWSITFVLVTYKDNWIGVFFPINSYCVKKISKSKVPWDVCNKWYNHFLRPPLKKKLYNEQILNLRSCTHAETNLHAIFHKKDYWKLKLIERTIFYDERFYWLVLIRAMKFQLNTIQLTANKYVKHIYYFRW